MPAEIKGLAGGVPTDVGQYQISGKLGEGTFGVVLKGTHKLAGERVAVKVLEKRRMQQADDIERVGREIQILKQLRHPHVVRLWEIIYASSRIYLVMEFAAKGELFQYIVKQVRLRARGAYQRAAAAHRTSLTRALSLRALRRAGCARTRASASSSRLWPASRTSTQIMWCTATSSRRICSSTASATSASSTLASRPSARGVENGCARERPPPQQQLARVGSHNPHLTPPPPPTSLPPLFPLRCAPGQVLKHACGSPCYAAPEMLTREGQATGYVGHPVDIWSTGASSNALPHPHHHPQPSSNPPHHLLSRAPFFCAACRRDALRDDLRLPPL